MSKSKSAKRNPETSSHPIKPRTGAGAKATPPLGQAVGGTRVDKGPGWKRFQLVFAALARTTRNPTKLMAMSGSIMNREVFRANLAS